MNWSDCKKCPKDICSPKHFLYTGPIFDIYPPCGMHRDGLSERFAVNLYHSNPFRVKVNEFSTLLECIDYLILQDITLIEYLQLLKIKNSI